MRVEEGWLSLWLNWVDMGWVSGSMSNTHLRLSLVWVGVMV